MPNEKNNGGCVFTFHLRFQDLWAVGCTDIVKELIEMIDIVKQHRLPAIFTEENGSASAAKIIAAETGSKVFSLDMAIAGDSYFDAMYHNIRTVKEALE